MKPIYWIDSGVLIQAEKGLYSHKLVPQFWSFLHNLAEAGQIQMPRRAWREVVDGGYTDDLSKWCKHRKDYGLCVHENEAIQEKYNEVAQHVSTVGLYKTHQINEFLTGADGWVIASAMATRNGIVVTEESGRSVKGKIKIPTVCKALDVARRNTRQMLDELDANFSKGI